jgi:hypothetical protein
MDPNETLKAIRKLMNQWEDGLSFLSPSEVDAFLDEVCEHVITLDEWLSKGGFHPSDWS